MCDVICFRVAFDLLKSYLSNNSESEQLLVKHIIKNAVLCIYLSLERACVYETVAVTFFFFKAIKQSHKALLSVVAKLTNVLLLLFFIFYFNFFDDAVQ